MTHKLGSLELLLLLHLKLLHLKLLQLELSHLKLLQLMTNQGLILLRNVTRAVVGRKQESILLLLLRTSHTIEVSTTHDRPLLLQFLKLGGSSLTAHLHAETKIVSLEELMVVGSSLGSASDTREAPSVELASERSKLGVLKVDRQDFHSKLLFLVNDESPAVREPSDDVGVFLRGEDLHKL